MLALGKLPSESLLRRAHAPDSFGRPQRYYTSVRAPGGRQPTTQPCAKEGAKEMALVSKEESGDGTVLFCFGSEAEAAAAADAAPQETQPAPQETQPAPQAAVSPEPAEQSPKEEPSECAAPANGSAPVAPTPEQSEQPAVAASGRPGGQAAAASNGSGASSPVPTSLRELEELKVAELKDLCRDRNVKGYTKMPKQEMIDALGRELFAPS